MKERRWLEWGLVLAATLVAAFLRFYRLGAESLWDGEIFTLLFARYDWANLPASVSAFSAHPPLWFVITKVIITGGWNETLLRAPAAFAGIAAVPALYALGKRLLDARAGVVGAALLAFSPMHVLFSQNARNYAFFVLLVILMVYAAVRAVEGGSVERARREMLRRENRETAAESKTARWWALFVVCGLAGLYTHYLFVLPLAGTVLAIALKLVRGAVAQTGNWRNARGWGGVTLVSGRAFLIALIAITALYLPWTPTVGSAFLGRQLTREAGHEEDENAALTLEDAPRLLKDFSGEGSWGLVLFGALAAVGIARAWWSGNRASLFWFGIAVALPLLFMVFLAPRRLPAKYLIYVLPAYLLFVAHGIGGVADAVGKLWRGVPGQSAVPTALMLGVLAMAAAPNMPYWNGARTIFTGEGWLVVEEWKPWREVAAHVTKRAGAGDMLLFPDEARALTARSVVPYFDDAFLEKVYSAPPNGRVWWVSEAQDGETTRRAPILANDAFGQVVVQEWQPGAPFREIEVPNASFEDGFKSWQKSNELAQWSRDETDKIDGTASARATMLRADNAVLRSEAFEVTPGKLYRVTAYVKNPTFGFYTVSPQLFVNFYAASNKPPKRTRLPTLVPSDKAGWMLMVSDGIVPEDAKTARVEFLFRDYAKALNPTSRVDNVQVWVEE